MPTPIHQLEGIEYVAGRTHTLNGEKYEAGDPVPAEELANTHIEALIRSRHVIPVVDSLDSLPKVYWREVKVRSEVLDKLGKGPGTAKIKPISVEPNLPSQEPAEAEEEAEEDTAFDPAEHTAVEVLEYVDEHPEEKDRILLAELEGKSRTTLISKLDD